MMPVQLCRWPHSLLWLLWGYLLCVHWKETRATDAGVLDEPFLLVGNRDIIQQISLNGEEAVVILNDTDYDVIGVDFDSREGYMYWIDVAARSINRACLNGTGKTTLIDTDMRTPDGIAWDWVTKKVYWTDSGRRRVEVYDPERQIRKQLVNTGRRTLPRDIAIDPTTGWLFWTDWGNTPKIERVSMDGAGQTTVHSSGIMWPNGLAIDYNTHTLFWTDANLDKIEFSNYDGSNRTVLIEGLFIFYPFGMTFYEGKLYWGDWVVGFIFELTVSFPADQFEIVREVFAMEPTGVEVVSLSKQPEVPTPCSGNNGNCSHLCLISALAPEGYRCSCPHRFRLSPNRRDCVSTEPVSPTPVTPSPPATGSCRAANYTECCVDGDCRGVPSICLCSAQCRDLGQCCADIESSCPSTPLNPNLQQEYLILANKREILQVELNGESQKILVSGQQNTVAVDYDIRTGYMYWTDVGSSSIRSSLLNGSNVSTLISSGVRTPDGIAVDWINHKLYWTDATLKSISVYDLLEGHRKEIINTGRSTIPRTIIVDPALKWFYWSDWGVVAMIQRASMDGQGQEVVVGSNLVWPNGLTIDYATQSLYWADAMLDRIESSNVDGSNRHVLTTFGVHHPFSLAILGTNLYWSDWTPRAIMTGTSGVYLRASILISINGTDPMGLQALSIHRQPIAPNPCASSGRRCSHMCLLSAVATEGFSCVVPEEVVLRGNTSHYTSQTSTVPEKAAATITSAPSPSTTSLRTASHSSPSPPSPLTPSPIVSSNSTEEESSKTFKANSVIIILTVVIAILAVTVVAMVVFVCTRFGFKKRRSFLNKRVEVEQNDYVIVVANQIPHPAPATSDL